MKLKNLIAASGLVALTCGCSATKYDFVEIENESYVCKYELAYSSGLNEKVYLINRQGKTLSSYSKHDNLMKIFGPTGPLTFWQAAQLTEECTKKLMDPKK